MLALRHYPIFTIALSPFGNSQLRSHYSLRSETVCLLSYENAIWKPIPTFPIGKELKQQISSLKRKQMVSPFSLEGDGGGYLFSFDNELLYRGNLKSQHWVWRVNRQLHENYTFVKTSY